MSRARVALDALLELGGGSRGGAAEALAEVFAEDPALLQAALARVWPAHAGGGEALLATLIATQWDGPAEYRRRLDLLRGNPVAELRQRRRPTGERCWIIQVWPDGVMQDLGDALILEEGQRTADEALTEGAERRWHLL